MILLDIAKHLKEKMGYDEIPTLDLVNVLRDGFVSIKTLALEEGGDFALQVPKFGTFRIMLQEARTGYNPQKRQPMKIAAKYRMRLKVSSVFKEELGLLKIVKSKSKKKSKKKTNKK